jgi:hypothetical protein
MTQLLSQVSVQRVFCGGRFLSLAPADFGRCEVTDAGQGFSVTVQRQEGSTRWALYGVSVLAVHPSRQADYSGFLWSVNQLLQSNFNCPFYLSPDVGSQ